ncbi:MAG: SGNH/GDSL hydrolase family protein [Opitutaceae bacterium]|nr:SGNH/GDSL hydrolase family protein [Opitutaceae bacterium]
MSRPTLLAAAIALAALAPAVAAPRPAALPAGVQRVLFLGDSITHGGGYVVAIETYLLLRHPARRVEFINCGLSSETVSGLSEDGHAGGQFPRPDLHERLGRVLAQTKPDLVFACYGMNDGIQQPFDEGRFARFRDGITRLREAVARTGARLIHVTPPVFDEIHGRAPGYDGVLARYAAWLVAQRSAGWTVIDLHTAMRTAIDERRRTDPKFTFARDSVHPDEAGHWVMARAILTGLGATDLDGVPSAATMAAVHPHGAAIAGLVAERQNLMKLAWLTATGHQRPGVKAGLPLADARERAAALDRRISGFLQNPTASNP